MVFHFGMTNIWVPLVYQVLVCYHICNKEVEGKFKTRVVLSVYFQES